MQKWIQFKNTALHYLSYIISYTYVTGKLAQDSHSFLSNIPNDNKPWSFWSMKTKCENSVFKKTAKISLYLKEEKKKHPYHHSCERKIKSVLACKDWNSIFLFPLNYSQIIFSARVIRALGQSWKQKKPKSDCLLTSAYCELWTSDSGTCVLS